MLVDEENKGTKYLSSEAKSLVTYILHQYDVKSFQMGGRRNHPIYHQHRL